MSGTEAIKAVSNAVKRYRRDIETTTCPTVKAMLDKLIADLEREGEQIKASTAASDLINTEGHNVSDLENPTANPEDPQNMINDQ